MSQSASNEHAVSAAADINVPEQPQYFMKANVDCWENVFDYLSSDDIIAMIQTCKRMQQIGGYYFQQNFPDIPVHWLNNQYVSINGELLQTKYFCNRIQSLRIFRTPDQVLNVENVGSLKKLYLEFIHLTDIEFSRIKNVLNNIAEIVLYGCTISGVFFDQLLQNTPKMKCLNLVNNTFESDPLYFKHPTLQRIKYESQDSDIFEFMNMFQQNPNIKDLTIDDSVLLKGEKVISKLNIRLNRLTVYLKDSSNYEGVANLLRSMYDMYNSLHIYIYKESESGLSYGDKLVCMGGNLMNIDLTHLIHLKELHFNVVGVVDMEPLVMHLTQLQRLKLGEKSFDKLLPFFRHSKTLKAVLLKVIKTVPLDTINYEALNLVALNKAREELGAKQRVVIYASEEIYLKTKWATKNLNLNLVEVVRCERIDPNQWSFLPIGI